ncbi:MAG: hypothetical protein ACKOUT_00730 [Novosphingobium sp.]
MPLIGVRARDLRNALLPPVLGSLAMALGVTLLERVLPAMPALVRLGLEVAAGGAIYAGWMLAFARERLRELTDLVLKR